MWVGFLVTWAGLLTYIPIFAQFPITRDFPWVNLLLAAVGLLLMGIGLVRAFGKPQAYRGRIFGSVLAVLAIAGTGLFCWGTIYNARQLPASANAPRVGQKAPDFTLSDEDGNPVALADLLSSATTTSTQSAAAKPGGALLIFYRGYW
jgi:hypothetical protein